MSIKLMSMIWDDHTGELTGIEKAVLVKMADHAADNGTQIFPSVRRISIDIGFCQTAVKEAIKGLIEKKRLSKTIRSKKLHHITNLYRINVSVLEQKAAKTKVNNIENVDKPVDNSGISGGVRRQTTKGLGARRLRGGSPHDRKSSYETLIRNIPIEHSTNCSKNEQEAIYEVTQLRLSDREKLKILKDIKNVFKRA